jgi:hypothetical protein
VHLFIVIHSITTLLSPRRRNLLIWCKVDIVNCRSFDRLKRKTSSTVIGWCLMGGKRLPPEERKELMTIRLKKKYIDEMKKIPGYMNIIEDLIQKYLKKNKD